MDRLSELLKISFTPCDQQTTKFCSAHGLNILNGYVQLNKSEFFQPDYLIPVVRSVSIIEKKNKSLIGEVSSCNFFPAGVISICF